MTTLEELRKAVSSAFREQDLETLRSLLVQYRQLPGNAAAADTLRIRAMIAKSNGEIEDALNLFDQARSRYEDDGDVVAAALTLNDLGSVYSQSGRYAEAVARYQTVVEILMTSGQIADAIPAMHNISLCYNMMGMAREALDGYLRCIEVSIEHKDMHIAGMSYNGLANVYQSQGEYAQSIEAANKALDLARLHESSKVAFYAYRNLGVAYSELADYPTALKHYHAALDIAQQQQQQRRLGQISTTISNLYFALNDLNESQVWTERALSHFEHIGDIAGVAACSVNLANVHNKRGETEAAVRNYDRALKIYIDLGNEEYVSSTLCNMAACLFDAERYDEGQLCLDRVDPSKIQHPGTLFLYKQLLAGVHKRSGDVEGAEAIYRECLSIAEEHRMQTYAAEAHNDLREIALLKNDLAGYVHHNTRSTQITDELNGVATAQKIAALTAERQLTSERQEREKERAVLYSTLPKHIADRIVRGEQVTGDHYDNAAVFFVDIVGFTAISEQLSASEVVNFLERLFSQFDEICKRHGVTKIKTIGDSYMAVSFPSQQSNSQQQTASPIQRAAAAALDILRAVNTFSSPTRSPEGSPARSPEGSPAMSPEGSPTRSPEGSPARSPEGSPLRVRIGIHAGALMAGVIGTERLQYDVWGDTVNVASRLESTGEPGKIHVSEQFASALRQLAQQQLAQQQLAQQQQGQRPQDLQHQDLRHSDVEPGTWHVELRGDIELKGKGTMTTYWIVPAP